MWKIIENLYLGTKEDSNNAIGLRENGITHILNCAAELPCCFEGSFDYLHLLLKDPDETLREKLAASLAFIDRGRAAGIVIVDCSGAISRSPAVVLAYLLHCGYPLDEATRTIKKTIRTRPNYIFLRQICDHFGQNSSDKDIATLSEELGIANS